MTRVRLSEPCEWEGVRYETGDVIEVPDRIQELNDGWMKRSKDEITPADSRPTAKEAKAADENETDADEAKKLEKARKKAVAADAKANLENSDEGK